jgi:hypothetical protein
MGCLPVEILEAGVVQLTGVIHACSLGMPFLWDIRARTTPDRIDWPEESGGQRTVEKIFERCRQIREPTFERTTNENLFETHPDLAEHTIWVDPVLHELLEPERRRQQTEMLRPSTGFAQLLKAGGKHDCD